MFLHMIFQSVNILKESYMTKLINLIVSDNLHSHVLTDKFHIGKRCRNCGNTRARKTYL